MGRMQNSQVRWQKTAGGKILQRNFLYLKDLRKVVSSVFRHNCIFFVWLLSYSKEKH